MTEEEMKKQIQAANDMLSVLQAQRNQANDEKVQISAQLIAAQRRIQELEQAASPKEGEVLPPPAKNGHDVKPALAS